MGVWCDKHVESACTSGKGIPLNLQRLAENSVGRDKLQPKVRHGANHDAISVYQFGVGDLRNCVL